MSKRNKEISKQHLMVSGTNGIVGAMKDAYGRIAGDPIDEQKKPPKAVVPRKVEPGVICQVDGLKSEGGKKLNGRRCAILRYVEGEERYEVRMEKERDGDKTYALKKANLKILPKLALPTHSERGSESTPRSLCELLLYHKGSGPYTRSEFDPSQITLQGYAANRLNQIGDSYLGWMVPCQLEQIAGVLALGSICQDYEESGAEEVLFAFLEGDPMYIDVLIQTIHWTAYIESDSEENDEINSAGFSNVAPTKLTPDQSSKQYVRIMSTGPFRIMTELTKYKFGKAMWAALKRSEFYHLAIQRMLRITARETLGTPDGIKLGPMARKILLKVQPGIRLEQPIRSKSTAEDLLLRTRRSPCQFLRPEDDITADVINAMFLLEIDTDSD